MRKVPLGYMNPLGQLPIRGWFGGVKGNIPEVAWFHF